MTNRTDARVVDERTHLLDDAAPSQQPKGTPLPKVQLAIILFLQMCEAITSQSIYPYLNQLIAGLEITGGDERKVGYYIGILESLISATEAATVLQWGRVSDNIGRKPVLLIGLFGVVLSMLSFGLSRTFMTLVISRCLNNLLNGNAGVLKTVIGELTDSSNREEGFALMPVMWGIGATIGPLLGGSLLRPQDRFPAYFSGSFWKDYPYFLPSLITSSFMVLAFLITLVFFNETLYIRKSQEPILETHDGVVDTTCDEPVSLCELLTYPVVLSVSNFVVLAFLGAAFHSLSLLFWAMPLEIGGMNLDPPSIGLIRGLYSAVGAVFQAFFFVRALRHFGTRWVFITAISMYIPLFALFPMMNMAARWYGQKSGPVYCLGVVFIALMAISDIAFGAIFMFVTASAPNKRSLGATNGLAQTAVSIARAVCPALATSLFSLSVQMNLTGGYGAYSFFGAVACFAVLLAARLPEGVWSELESDAAAE